MSTFFFFSSRRRHTRWNCDWSSDVCSSDLSWDSRELCQVVHSPSLGIQLSVQEDIHLGVRLRFGVFELDLRAGELRKHRSEEGRVGKECRSRWSAGEEWERTGR